MYHIYWEWFKLNSGLNTNILLYYYHLMSWLKGHTFYIKTIKYRNLGLFY